MLLLFLGIPAILVLACILFTSIFTPEVLVLGGIITFMFYKDWINNASEEFEKETLKNIQIKVI